MRRSHRLGFTLIELSIVLVIIGLLAGGVLTGKTLIHQSKMRAIITDSEKIQLAMRAYQIRYRAWPGDHSQASTLLAGQVSGDGDGIVSGLEGQRVYNHLEASGIFVAERHPNSAVHMQSRSYNDSGISVLSGAAIENAAVGLRFSRMQPEEVTVNFRITGGFMTPADGYSLDVKMDDGKGATGKIVGLRASGGGMSWGDCSVAHTANIITEWKINQTSVRGCQLYQIIK